MPSTIFSGIEVIALSITRRIVMRPNLLFTWPMVSNFPGLKEAVQWINQAADEHARKVRTEFFEAVDEVIEFLDERRDADSEGCNTEMRLYGVLGDAFACYKRTLAHNDIEILPS